MYVCIHIHTDMHTYTHVFLYIGSHKGCNMTLIERECLSSNLVMGFQCYVRA